MHGNNATIIGCNGNLPLNKVAMLVGSKYESVKNIISERISEGK